MKPLNGEKTHPLSAVAKQVLRDVGRIGPLPAQEINPGVINRLRRESLIEIRLAPSPYKTHKGQLIAHAFITDAGLSVIGVASQPKETDHD